MPDIEITFSLDNASIGELMEFEELSGEGIERLDELRDGKRTATMKEFAVFVYLSEKRKNPDYTWEEALKHKASDVRVPAPKKKTTRKRPTKASSS